MYLAAATLSVIVSLLLAVEVHRPDLFQRSGALVVLFALIVEARIASRGYYNAAPDAWNDWLGGFPIVRGLSRRGETIAVTAHAFVLGGTLLSAYGDLLLHGAAGA